MGRGEALRIGGGAPLGIPMGGGLQHHAVGRRIEELPLQADLDVGAKGRHHHTPVPLVTAVFLHLGDRHGHQVIRTQLAFVLEQVVGISHDVVIVGFQRFIEGPRVADTWRLDDVIAGDFDGARQGAIRADPVGADVLVVGNGGNTHGLQQHRAGRLAGGDRNRLRRCAGIKAGGKLATCQNLGTGQLRRTGKQTDCRTHRKKQNRKFHRPPFHLAIRDRDNQASFCRWRLL